MANNRENEIENINEHIEDEERFFSNIIIDSKKIQREDINPQNEYNINKGTFGHLRNLVNRKNIIKYGILTGEEPIRTEESDGSVSLSIINKEQIIRTRSQMKAEDRVKIKFVHIATIQVIIKSTFVQGINTPMELRLVDNRIKHRQESIIAQGNCNLKEGKAKFDVNLNIGLALQRDAHIDRSIVIYYKFLRRDLFKEGAVPFSISYAVNYALSNSHHSLELKRRDLIHIDELFKPLISLSKPMIRGEVENRSSRLILENIEEASTSYQPPKNIPLKEIEKPLSIEGSTQLRQLTNEIEKLKALI